MTGVADRRSEGAADELNFERILAEHLPAVSRLARSFTNSESDRQDLLQEIAIALWKALPHFRGECSERTFLFRIAHNRAADWLSRNKAPAAQADFDLPDPSPGAEAELVRRERMRRLLNAVRRLPSGQRQTMILALEGLSYRDIADVLGISESNAGARLTRARAALREFLEVDR
jgi:RNA polymerase sigma-70 factor (ECF subfamily)